MRLVAGRAARGVPGVFLRGWLALAAWQLCSAGSARAESLAAGSKGQAIEVLAVSAGAPVVSKTVLAPGELYLLRAKGTIALGGRWLDAEFIGGAGARAADAVAGVDVGIDVGLLQVHPAQGYKAVADGPGRMKWFGGERADHTHYLLVTGAGRPLTCKFVLPPGAAGAGALALALYPLSPPPPSLGDALDVVRVPVLKVTEATALVSQPGVVYLLQAAGAGGVGGGGLHLGDAEYMDWAADGKGKNEGEAGSDFGVGVDEPVPVPKSRGAAYPRRQRWWGPWRADHVYYMLFLGTGKPIELAYHDSGYGDNSRSDALIVKVFAAPL